MADLLKPDRIVVGVAGGTGVILAYHLICELIAMDFTVDLVISTAGAYTAKIELNLKAPTAAKFCALFPAEKRHLIIPHHINDFGATIASGSHLTAGMVIVPCSMATLAAVAIGLSDNLLRRAADVTLKEKRNLVIVPRESPLSEIHLENLLKLARAGARIVPPMPAWYTNPQSVVEIERGIVGRILDSMGIYSAAFPRWEGVVK